MNSLINHDTWQKQMHFIFTRVTSMETTPRPLGFENRKQKALRYVVNQTALDTEKITVIS